MLHISDLMTKEVRVSDVERHLDRLNTFQDFFKISKLVDITEDPNKKRTVGSVFHKVVEEVGELSTEIGIIDGHLYKEPGKDGVTGEAIDMIIAGLDLVHKSGCSEREFTNIMKTKIGKWLKNSGTMDQVAVLESQIPEKQVFIK